MAILLHLSVLVICLYWLNSSSKSSGALVGITFTFLGAIVVLFIASFALGNDYLDGLIHLLVVGGSAVAFWVLSIIMLLIHARKNDDFGPLLGQLLIVSIVILVPLLIYLLLMNASFKIGG